jgi:hypothetical protein
MINNADVAAPEVFGISEMTMDEVDLVSGAGPRSGAAALGAAAAVGAATWGGTWGAMTVGAAFAAAPVAVIGMAALVCYGAYAVFAMD